MRRAGWIALVVAAACDSSPPRTAPTPAVAAAVADDAARAASPSSTQIVNTAPSMAQPDVVSPDCISVADHLVGLSIAAIASPGEQAAQTANRARTVRETAESCTRGGWTPEVIGCFAAASTADQLAACGKLVAALPKR